MDGDPRSGGHRRARVAVPVRRRRRADRRRVDRLLLYRAPVVFGEGIPAFRDPGSNGVPSGWTLEDRRPLGSDTLEVYTPG
jgi:riboflavin biosynthesis pyrimidine reductase